MRKGRLATWREMVPIVALPSATGSNNASFSKLYKDFDLVQSAQFDPGCHCLKRGAFLTKPSGFVQAKNCDASQLPAILLLVRCQNTTRLVRQNRPRKQGRFVDTGSLCLSGFEIRNPSMARCALSCPRTVRGSDGNGSIAEPVLFTGYCKAAMRCWAKCRKKTSATKAGSH